MREVSDAARKGAIAGAVVGGTLSGADNLRAWRRGNVSGSEALIATSKAAASAGGRGAIVAAGARVITIAARQAGHIRFASGSGPAAVASAAIDLGGVLNRYVRGNISPDELRDESVNILAGAALSTYCGIAGQILIPVPVAGALIGSLVGTAVSGLVLEAGALGTSASDRARRARVAEWQIHVDGITRLFTGVCMAWLRSADISAGSLGTETSRSCRVRSATALSRSSVALTVALLQRDLGLERVLRSSTAESTCSLQRLLGVRESCAPRPCALSRGQAVAGRRAWPVRSCISVAPSVRSRRGHVFGPDGSGRWSTASRSTADSSSACASRVDGVAVVEVVEVALALARVRP